VQQTRFRELPVGGSGDDHLASNSARSGFGGDRTLEGGPGADQLVSEGSYNDDLREDQGQTC